MKTPAFKISMYSPQLSTETFKADCPGEAAVPVVFRRVAFWYFTYDPSLLVAATFCSPAIELWTVNVTVDIATSNVTSVMPLSQLVDYNAAAGGVSSITGPPNNGKAFNGIEFDFDFLLNNEFVMAKENATRLQLPAAVMQAVETTQVYTREEFNSFTNQVYVCISPSSL